MTYVPLALAALQAVLGIIVKLATDGREWTRVRRLRHLFELQATATPDQQQRMDPLINAAIDDLVEAGLERFGRKIKGAGVAAVAIVSIFLAVCTGLLLWWGFSIDSGWKVAVFVVTGLFAAMSFTVVIAGLPTIYEPRTPPDDASGAAS
ncbi:hypothetical protein LSF60_05455 [Rhodococcus pyridinivorans]|uniref:hypothetical protein n=1 Tax=Rhodococcus pyridinivorans TaxID=103816 RepID=UPI001E502F90|nr:hypothetical protein [Rhodococcus pyridinivorans]UGQ58959.1 hypothetical protein LSF60_05455 [Rhodococcus pyridinivorans]